MQHRTVSQAGILLNPTIAWWLALLLRFVRTHRGEGQHGLPCEPRTSSAPAAISRLRPQPSLPSAPPPALTPPPAPSPGRPPPAANAQPPLTFDDANRALGGLRGEPRTGVRFSIHFAVMRALNESGASLFAEASLFFFEAEWPHWRRELEEAPARVVPGAHIAEAQDAADVAGVCHSSADAGWGAGVVTALADGDDTSMSLDSDEARSLPDEDEADTDSATDTDSASTRGGRGAGLGSMPSGQG